MTDLILPMEIVGQKSSCRMTTGHCCLLVQSLRRGALKGVLSPRGH